MPLGITVFGFPLQTSSTVVRPSCPRNLRYERKVGREPLIFTSTNTFKMLSFVARSANLSSSTVAVTQTVANGTKALMPAVTIQTERTLVPPPAKKLTTNSLTATLPISPLKAAATIGGKDILRSLT